jgi:hypothetical protein
MGQICPERVVASSEEKRQSKEGRLWQCVVIVRSVGQRRDVTLLGAADSFLLLANTLQRVL